MPYEDETLIDPIYREAVLFLETDGKFPSRDQVGSILYGDLLEAGCSLEMFDRCYHRCGPLARLRILAKLGGDYEPPSTASLTGDQ